jgi:hypothetical protein
VEENTLTLTGGFFAEFSTIRIINWNFIVNLKKNSQIMGKITIVLRWQN